MYKPYQLFAALLLLVFCYKPAHAQTIANNHTDTLINQRAQNAFIEVGSAGIVFSANCDTRFSKKRNGWGGRIGFSYWGNNGDRIYLVPVQVNYLFGRTKNFFELGTGITTGTIHSDDGIFNNNSKNISGAIGTITAGFRHQALGKGVFYKISLDAVYDTEDLRNWFGFCGIGLGYTFK